MAFDQPSSLEGVLARIPGLAGYLAQTKYNQQSDAANQQQLTGQLGQAGSLLQIQEHLRQQQQDAQMRDALQKSGGDIEKALPILLQSGNLKGVQELTPALKLAQEKKQHEQTIQGMKDLNAVLNGPEQLSGPDMQSTPMGDGKLIKLRGMQDIYAGNASVSTQIQKEIDRLEGDKKPIIQMLPIPGNKEQPHISIDGGKTFTPIPGSSPRDIFSPSQNQIVVPPEQAKNLAVMRATGMPAMQVMPGYSRNLGNARTQLNQDAINYIAQTQGMTPEQASEELANRDISYASGKKSVGQLNTMLGATRAALSQLDFNVNKVSELMKEMPGDALPVINAIQRGVQKWTGDPKYSQLFYYMHAAGMESARILSNGQASIAQLHTGAAEEAKKWADANWTTPQAWLQGVAPAMHAEAENRIQNFTQAMKAQRSSANPGAVAPASPATNGPPPPAGFTPL